MSGVQSEQDNWQAVASQRILDIILQFSLNKFDDIIERHARGRSKFLSVIESFIAQSKAVEMCLPAFPFKSANKVYKVLGILPDKAEELALSRLNTMCLQIGRIYRPGAELTIISDGLTYNDLLCISDQHTWAYGEALRAMACRMGFDHIRFSRIRDLIDCSDSVDLNEILYVAGATNFRRRLLNEFGNDDIDIEHEINTNNDTMLTYLGYRRFLESDLKHMFPVTKDRSNKTYKKNVKFLAQQMLIRGFAFAAAVKKAFPNHLRLSIHQSTGEHKVSLALLNTKTGFTTPWHCSVALMANGEWLSAPKGDFEGDPRLELVYEEGRPSYFREKAKMDLSSLRLREIVAGKQEEVGEEEVNDSDARDSVVDDQREEKIDRKEHPRGRSIGASTLALTNPRLDT